MALAIRTNNLGKRYGAVTAVDRLSLNVAAGEIYAFLGLNGAGKTTTIRMLLGMIKPSSGAATVLQTVVRPGSTQPWAQVGFLVETPHAYPELTVRENLEVARRLHPGTPREAVGKIIEQLGLGAYADRRAGTLSLGNAQRLGLARAMLHGPKLLILDEPANGLDPAGIVEIRQLLLQLTRDQGVTIFMSSHILSEVARLAGRIGIIHQGRLVQEMSVGELEQNRQRRLIVRTRDSANALSLLVAAGYGRVEISDGDALRMADPAAFERPDEVAIVLVNGGIAPTELHSEEEDLEHYFLRLIGANGGGVE